MNGLDIALFVVLFFFFVRGIFRGFVKEFTSIVGVAAGFLLASRFYPAAADALKPVVQNAAYRQALGFQVMFLGIFFLVSLLGVVMDRLIKLTITNVANSLAGAALATAKGLVISAVVLMAATAFITPDSKFFKESASWPYMRTFSQKLKEYVPDDLQKALKDKTNILPPGLKPGTTTPPKDGAAPPSTTGGAVVPPPPAWPGKPNQ